MTASGPQSLNAEAAAVEVEAAAPPPTEAGEPGVAAGPACCEGMMQPPAARTTPHTRTRDNDFNSDFVFIVRSSQAQGRDLEPDDRRDGERVPVRAGEDHR